MTLCNFNGRLKPTLVLCILPSLCGMTFTILLIAEAAIRTVVRRNAKGVLDETKVRDGGKKGDMIRICGRRSRAVSK